MVEWMDGWTDKMLHIHVWMNGWMEWKVDKLTLLTKSVLPQVKLQEFYSSLKEKNPKFNKESPLPDLPGKILFGRSQVHQVAEKRRVKVEEFCQVHFRQIMNSCRTII